MLTTRQLYVTGCQHSPKTFVTGMGKSRSSVLSVSLLSVSPLVQKRPSPEPETLPPRLRGQQPGPPNSCLGYGETTLKITLRCDKSSGEQRNILKPLFPRRFLQRFGREGVAEAAAEATSITKQCKFICGSKFLRRHLTQC